MFTACLTAPPAESIVILAPEAVNPYTPIVNAISTIESANGKYMLNEKEMAVGYFGIRPIRLNDYNKKTRKHITLDQCYDYETGKTILLYYISQVDYRDIKGIAIAWNGISTRNLYYGKLQKAL
jgi:hypothetical protein